MRAFGPALLVHSWAGNVPGLPLWSLACGLLVKAGNVGKLPSAEPVFASVFARLLAQVHPPLARLPGHRLVEGRRAGSGAGAVPRGRHRAGLWRQRGLARGARRRCRSPRASSATATSSASPWWAAMRSTRSAGRRRRGWPRTTSCATSSRAATRRTSFYVERGGAVDAARVRAAPRGGTGQPGAPVSAPRPGARRIRRRRCLAPGGRMAGAGRAGRRTARATRTRPGPSRSATRRSRWRRRPATAASSWARSTRSTRSSRSSRPHARLPADRGHRHDARRSCIGSPAQLGRVGVTRIAALGAHDAARGRLAPRRPLQPGGPGAHGGDRARRRDAPPTAWRPRGRRSGREAPGGSSAGTGAQRSWCAVPAAARRRVRLSRLAARGRGRGPRARARRVPLPGGPQRLRQDHAAQARRRPARAHRGRRAAAGRAPAGAGTSASSSRRPTCWTGCA